MSEDDGSDVAAGNREGTRQLDGWPLALTGVTETVVTTEGPNGRWNAAALGLHAPDAPSTVAREGRVVARTWGRTRTRRNFEARGAGVINLTRDPVDFVEAALGVRELDEPTLESAAATVPVTVERVGAGTDGGTAWVDWALAPDGEATVTDRTVPKLERGVAAVVEATVAASRLDVEGFDEDDLKRRLAWCEDVVARCGGPRAREAMDRLSALVAAEW